MATLGQLIGFNYAFQGAFAAVAIPLQTERFYDFAGSLGFISSTLLATYAPNVQAIVRHVAQRESGSLLKLVKSLPWSPLAFVSGRQAVMSAMVLFWAGRLGSFLVQRIAKHGSDSRFDEIKTKPLAFLGAWVGQATWITLSGLPLWLVASVPAHRHVRLGASPWDWLGIGIWVLGMTLEVLADNQKSAWRKARDEKKHDEPFIKSGLWSWSRHPNYAGEIILWSGPSLLALTTLLHTSPVGGAFAKAAPFLCAVPSLFEYLLLTRVSGVPMLEQSGDKKFAKDSKKKAQWEEYKRKVPVLFALPGKHI